MSSLTRSDLDQLRALVEKHWVEAAVARDWDALLALCTDDFVYMPQDHPALHGKEQTTTFLDGFPVISGFTQALESASGGVGLAALRGSFEITMQVDGARVSGKGKYLCTASSEGGVWRLSCACFNWDAPLIA